MAMKFGLIFLLLSVFTIQLASSLRCYVYNPATYRTDLVRCDSFQAEAGHIFLQNFLAGVPAYPFNRNNYVCYRITTSLAPPNSTFAGCAYRDSHYCQHPPKNTAITVRCLECNRDGCNGAMSHIKTNIALLTLPILLGLFKGLF